LQPLIIRKILISGKEKFSALLPITRIMLPTELNSPCYEEYPLRITGAACLLSLAIYSIGVAIMWRLSGLAAVFYALYVAWFEARLLSAHCVDCYYYGKRCAFGRGKLSSMLFKRGEPQRFAAKEMVWKDLAPDMLLSFVPLIVGIILLLRGSDLALLTGVVSLAFLISAGNAFVRGSLACKYCKQRESGCPAEKLFRNKSDPRE